MRSIGIDVGSTFTKTCVMEAGHIILLEAERTPVRQREAFTEKLQRLREMYGDCPIVTCGYGRKNIGNDETISELTALASGAARECPETAFVLDIGGQDTKYIRHENGKLKTFFINEKCAAGSGLFLGNVLRLLDMPFEEIDLTGVEKPKISLSSVCAVFAQSEIVHLMADGAEQEEIIHAVLAQVLVQARMLLGKMDGIGPIALSGGLTQIKGIGQFAEKLLERPVIIPKHAAYLSAVGCALRGSE